MTHRGPFQPLPFCDSVIWLAPKKVKSYSDANESHNSKVLLLWAEALLFILNTTQILMEKPQFVLLAFNY